MSQGQRIVAGSRRRIVWSAEMTTTLITMRTQPRPASLPQCARRIGVADSVVRRKARELGLNQGAPPGPAPGSHANSPRDRLGRFLRPVPRESP
jgi:hypothetical protein